MYHFLEFKLDYTKDVIRSGPNEHSVLHASKNLNTIYLGWVLSCIFTYSKSIQINFNISSLFYRRSDLESSSTQLRDSSRIFSKCSRRKKLHKYNSSRKEIPKMSLELSQVTKKHAGDFGPLSRWYFLRGVYWERKKLKQYPTKAGFYNLQVGIELS